MAVSLLRRLLAEAIGTFFLALAVAMPSQIQGFEVAFTICALAYGLGPISGAHVNPAVTLAILLRGKVSLPEAAGYILAQCAGAVVATVCAQGIVLGGQIEYPKVGENFTQGEALLGEIIFTATLCWVVLNTATTKAQENNSYFGISIAFVVLSAAFALGPVSGAVLNPAVGLVPLVDGHDADIWIYWVGPLVGSLVGSGVFWLNAPGEFHRQDEITKFRQLISEAGAEMWGTLVLTFTVALSPNAGTYAGFCIGAVLLSLVYAGAATSGAHYNPAVSFGVYLRGLKEPKHLIEPSRLLNYAVFQLCGAAAGGGMGLVVQHGNEGYPDLGHGYTWKAGLTCEMIYTGILVFIILHVATSVKSEGNSYFGIAIGLALASGIYAVGDISGAAFNPAVGLVLPAIANESKDKHIWVYLLGPMMGSILAAILFVITEDRDHSRRFNVYMEGDEGVDHRFAKYMPSADGDQKTNMENESALDDDYSTIHPNAAMKPLL